MSIDLKIVGISEGIVVLMFHLREVRMSKRLVTLVPLTNGDVINYRRLINVTSRGNTNLGPVW